MRGSCQARAAAGGRRPERSATRRSRRKQCGTCVSRRECWAWCSGSWLRGAREGNLRAARAQLRRRLGL
eukprot:7047554-Prymnesium_polylepis.1